MSDHDRKMRRLASQFAPQEKLEKEVEEATSSIYKEMAEGQSNYVPTIFVGVTAPGMEPSVVNAPLRIKVTLDELPSQESLSHILEAIGINMALVNPFIGYFVMMTPIAFLKATLDEGGEPHYSEEDLLEGVMIAGTTVDGRSAVKVIDMRRGEGGIVTPGETYTMTESMRGRDLPLIADLAKAYIHTASEIHAKATRVHVGKDGSVTVKRAGVPPTQSLRRMAPKCLMTMQHWRSRLH